MKFNTFETIFRLQQGVGSRQLSTKENVPDINPQQGMSQGKINFLYHYLFNATPAVYILIIGSVLPRKRP